jgi:hypothetical protein
VIPRCFSSSSLPFLPQPDLSPAFVFHIAESVTLTDQRCSSILEPPGQVSDHEEHIRNFEPLNRQIDRIHFSDSFLSRFGPGPAASQKMPGDSPPRARAISSWILSKSSSVVFGPISKGNLFSPSNNPILFYPSNSSEARIDFSRPAKKPKRSYGTCDAERISSTLLLIPGPDTQADRTRTASSLKPPDTDWESAASIILRRRAQTPRRSGRCRTRSALRAVRAKRRCNQYIS